MSDVLSLGDSKPLYATSCAFASCRRPSRQRAWTSIVLYAVGGAKVVLVAVTSGGFVAVVAANSLRAFMGHVAKLAFRVNSGGATSRAAVILLAELTGLYFCGALVMLCLLYTSDAADE